MPIRAACAATELARFPVEAQAIRLKPSSRAAVMATETTRSLNEWVGLAESSLTHSGAVKPSRSASRSARISGVMPVCESTRVRRVLADRQQPGVAPDRLRAGGDAGPVDPGQPVGVVADLQRAEALEAGVLGAERELGAAVAADQCRGRAVRHLAGGTIDGCGHARPLSSSFPRAASAGGPELAPNSPAAATRSCRAVSRWLPGLQRAGPSAPLDERTMKLSNEKVRLGAMSGLTWIAAARRRRRGSTVVAGQHHHDRAGRQAVELLFYPFDCRELLLQAPRRRPARRRRPGRSRPRWTGSSRRRCWCR